MRALLRGIQESDWFGLFLVAALAAVVLAALKPNFLSAYNIYVLLLGFSLWLLIAMAQMVIIAIGQMNLSVGAIGGLVAISFAGVMEVWGVPVPLAILAGLAIGLLCGLFNGFVTHATGISAFIITLATLSIFKGLNIGITEAQPFYDIPASVSAFGNARFGAVPYMTVIPILALIGMWLLMNRMPIGRQMLAMGANRHAAELSGISTARVVVAAHVISGGLAAIAGMLAVARLQLGQPTIGDDWLILSFAAPVIGGAVLAGGHISVMGTCMGVIIVTLINNALVLLGIDPFFVQLLLGLMILAAIALNRWRETRQAAKAAP